MRCQINPSWNLKFLILGFYRVRFTSIGLGSYELRVRAAKQYWLQFGYPFTFNGRCWYCLMFLSHGFCPSFLFTIGWDASSQDILSVLSTNISPEKTDKIESVLHWNCLSASLGWVPSLTKYNIPSYILCNINKKKHRADWERYLHAVSSIPLIK